MKAIVKKEAKRGGLSWEEVPKPSIGPKEVLVKVEKSSICGTDVHLYEWDAWAQKTLPVPCIIGHEFMGKIVELGKEVKGFSMGQRVSAEGHITCGKCVECRTGRRHLCPNTLGIGVNRNGVFAEFAAIPEENLFAIPDGIQDEIACIFDPLGNTFHTLFSCDLVGKDVLITGAGPIGTMAVAVAKKAGARHVVITDIQDFRLELAKKMRPTRAVNVAKENLAHVKKELNITGFDVLVEMSGSPHALASLPEHAAHGAHLLLLGILPTEAPINWHDVIFKMLTIKGIYGREIFRTWYQMTALLESGLDVSGVITHTFKASEFEKGFEVMLSGKCGKVILDWTK